MNDGPNGGPTGGPDTGWQSPSWRPEEPAGPRAFLGRSGGLVGMGGLACVLFLDLASATFLAWWVVVLLVLVWLVLLRIAVRQFTPRPRAVAALPLIGVALWLLCVWIAAST